MDLFSAPDSERADVPGPLADRMRPHSLDELLGQAEVVGSGRPLRLAIEQDTFLPHVESGAITLIGATTENPSFEVVSPLLSRSLVVVLQSLSEAALMKILERALADSERGLGRYPVDMNEDALRQLSVFAN